MSDKPDTRKVIQTFNTLHMVGVNTPLGPKSLEILVESTIKPNLQPNIDADSVSNPILDAWFCEKSKKPSNNPEL